MSMMKTILALGAGAAAIAASIPASAQYYSRWGYRSRMNINLASQQCTAAVQNRLYNRVSGGIIGLLTGERTNGQVLSVTQVNPRGDGSVRVRGLATSGRYAMNDYGRYGEGAYGDLGYGYARAADLSFRCDVAPNGAVYDISINHR